jgi:hypothetical protein
VSKQNNKPSKTIGKYDTLPDRADDQVQSNGIGNAEQKAKHKGSAPE